MARVLILSIFIVFFIVMCKGYDSNSLRLKQVLILSRHNLRTPLIAGLEVYSSKIWPKFNEPVAYLTKKGALLESYMAEYISDWMKTEGFIKGCPKPEEILIYSNTKPRTIDTAKSFAKSAFLNCNITSSHLENIEIFDPIFYPIFHNTTESFKNLMMTEMRRKLNSMNLTESYLELNKILDIQNSTACLRDSVCDLTAVKNEIFYVDGEEPNVIGPLTIGANIVDLFIMSYYEGFPHDKVAWGQINTDSQWDLLTKLTVQSQRVRFDFKEATKDIAKPLLEYIFKIFRNESPKFTMLVGHDSNMNSVIKAMGFKEFELQNQMEPFPIGGKLIFQKWSDGRNDYLKTEYIYPSTFQIRNGVKFSSENPPQRALLELNHCKIDNNGYCLWNDFMKFDF